MKSLLKPLVKYLELSAELYKFLPMTEECAFPKWKELMEVHNEVISVIHEVLSDKTNDNKLEEAKVKP